MMPLVAHSAGLGPLSILSRLGQPLVAEIDLISVQKEELASLTARLAAPEAFRRANIEYSPALVGVRLVIERRGNGQPYIRITSSRTVNEPFIDLLVELSWAQGRLVREYTALIDPPENVPGPVPAAPVAAAPVATPIAPAVVSAPAEAPAAKSSPAAARPVAAPAKGDGKEYGPVKRGDSLSKIAASVKPEGVTLEQTLVSLYRSNPDAFVGNMNRLRAGKILRIPEKEQIADTAQSDSVKEVRVQTANWNAYRQKLADSAGTTPARESKSSASGKISTTVDDKATGKQAPKEVLKLSKGEPVGGAGTKSGATPAAAQDRIRVLEEEATARAKNLVEANYRISQLEKTIKDMQRLLEVKGQVPGAPVAKPSVTTLAPAKAEPAKDVAKTEPAKDAGKMEPSKDAAKMEPAKDAGKAPTDAAKADQKSVPAEKPVVAEASKGEAPKMDAAKADLPTGGQAAVEPSQPKPKPKIVTVPPPPPAKDLVDEILGEPLYLAAGGGLLAALGGLGYWFMRRRASAADDDVEVQKQTPTLAKTSAPVAAAAALGGEAPLASDDVDPLAEADPYLNFGRDAQAEGVLKEALEKNPKHEEVQLKLLQIYAGRKDKVAYESVARGLQAQLGPTSANWLKAAAMGYSFDPGNALYEAGKSASADDMSSVTGGGPTGTDLDFDLELAPESKVTHTDFELDSGKTVIMEPGILAGMAEQGDPTSTMNITGDSGAARAIADSDAVAQELMQSTLGTSLPQEPDLTVDAPAAKTAMAEPAAESAAPMANMIDFNFDAPAPASGGKEFTPDGTVILDPENQDKSAGVTMDFNVTPTIDVAPEADPGKVKTVGPLGPDFQLDIGGDAPVAAVPDFKFDDINLNLDQTVKMEAAKLGGAKDDHWYDVQTKFDLAKAYQEMGDKEGAREILNEVIKEGDAGQQAEAKQLLATLA